MKYINLPAEYEKIKDEHKNDVVSLEDVQKSIASTLTYIKKDCHTSKSLLLKNRIEEKVRTIEGQLGLQYRGFELDQYPYHERILLERLSFDKSNIRLLNRMFSVVQKDNYQDISTCLAFLQNKYLSNLDYFDYSRSQVYYACKGIQYNYDKYVDDHMESIVFLIR